MAKSQDAKKSDKTAPAKSAKEKKAEKRANKGKTKYEQSSFTINEKGVLEIQNALSLSQYFTYQAETPIAFAMVTPMSAGEAMT